MTLDKRGVINETVASVLLGKHPHETITSCSMLEAYYKMLIFLPVDITEYVVKSITREFLGILGPGDMDSESLQRWLSKFRKDSK